MCRRRQRPCGFTSPTGRVLSIGPVLGAQDRADVTYKVELAPEGVVEVEYFGTTTYADRAEALDSLEILNEMRGPKRVLVNFLGAQVVGDDDAGRLDFIAKAITHPLLANCRIALVGIAHADAHPAETAGIIRLIKVRTFEQREQALAWLLDG
jgi:hypothetical protein